MPSQWLRTHILLWSIQQSVTIVFDCGGLIVLCSYATGPCCVVLFGLGCRGFVGDKRSFAMVKIAAHHLAGEKRKGWAVVDIVAEMCEALVGRCVLCTTILSYEVY